MLHPVAGQAPVAGNPAIATTNAIDSMVPIEMAAWALKTYILHKCKCTGACSAYVYWVIWKVMGHGATAWYAGTPDQYQEAKTVFTTGWAQHIVSVTKRHFVLTIINPYPATIFAHFWPFSAYVDKLGHNFATVDILQ